MQRAVLERFDRPLAAPDRGSDLLIGHVGEELQRQHLLLVFGQLRDRLFQRHAIEDRMDRILAMRVDKLKALVQRGRDGALPPGLADQDVAGDRVEPAEKGFFAAVLEPADAFDNPDKDLLRQILGAFLFVQAYIQVAQYQARVPGIQFTERSRIPCLRSRDDVGQVQLEIRDHIPLDICAGHGQKRCRRAIGPRTYTNATTPAKVTRPKSSG
jgi:hypothetical protein